MGIGLGRNRYGKAENRVVRIRRDTDRHEIRDLSVSTALTGDFAAAHLAGDQATVLPTDSQKQTVFAYAQEYGLDPVEDYALRLARHFVADIAPVTGARVEVEDYAWTRIVVAGAEHPHSWVRSGQEVRTVGVQVDETGESVVAGLRDLVLLKSTGSEFAGFLVDPYTVLEPADDRILATSLVARWRYTTAAGVDWDGRYTGVRTLLLERFATVHSLALQQTLYEMGRTVLTAYDDIAEIELVAPNRHHFRYDLAAFGLTNRNETFHADDRPYGLIEVTVVRTADDDGGGA